MQSVVRFFAISIFLGWAMCCHCQSPFNCEGQVWVISQDDNELLELTVNANNTIDTSIIRENIGEEIHAMGYRNTDRLLYGLHPTTLQLFTIDALGNVQNIGSPNLDPALIYEAGDVLPNGRNFVVIGSTGGVDRKLFIIDLTDDNFAAQEISFTNNTSTSDICFHPVSSTLFGYDRSSKSIFTQDFGSTAINIKAPIFNEHDIYGLYFDAFGNLYGYGTALFGNIAGLFEIDQLTGETRLISTSGLLRITDMAACPFSLEMTSQIFPPTTLPCSDLEFEYSFANQTGGLISNVTLVHELPAGYSFTDNDIIPFGGMLDDSTPENILRIENLNIPTGIQAYTINAYVDDIPKSIYKSQVLLANVPSEFGDIVLSGDPLTPAVEDSTFMEVNRFEEDSIDFYTFICHGSYVTLDASEYGNNLLWNNGASSQTIDVTETGLFSLTAESGCAELYVGYDVVSATCPYTIELGLLVEPDTIFGCSEVIFRYILENDSGEERFDVMLADTFPPGFSFVEIINNPYESELASGLVPNILQLEKILLHEGVDTIDVLVEVADIPPGVMRIKAGLKNLHQGLGPLRSSDDPRTVSFPDSTTFVVRGVEGSSMEIDTFLCEGVDLVLDASFYGDSHLWQDGTTQSELVVTQAGTYEVLILDGCDTASLIYYIEEAAQISVDFPNGNVSIHQSESIRLEPIITNEGDSLNISWTDESGNSLSCLICPDPIATPLNDIEYVIHVENEYCQDSALIELLVDESRRVYVPNVFSPDGDGNNDLFDFKSPDPGEVISFKIYNRWGSLLFERTNFSLGDQAGFWDGTINGELTRPGVYVWQAEIQFFDKKIEILTGDVTVVY